MKVINKPTFKFSAEDYKIVCQFSALCDTISEAFDAYGKMFADVHITSDIDNAIGVPWEQYRQATDLFLDFVHESRNKD